MHGTTDENECTGVLIKIYPLPFKFLKITLDPFNVYENIHAFPKESHLKNGFFVLIMLFFRSNNKHDYLSSLNALS